MNEIFQAALKGEIAESLETQTKIAERAKISVAYLNDLLHGRRHGTEVVRRQVAAAFGWQDYESFLNVGREALGLPAVSVYVPALETLDEPTGLATDEMKERGFFTVPFSDDMRLAAGSQHAIPFTHVAEDSHIVVHGPSLRRRNAKNLQAFRVGGSSMEPLIADGGIVLADTAHNDLRQIKEGRIYVLCWDLSDGECAVKYLRWAEKGRTLSIESENPLHKPTFRGVDEVVLIGKVIWAWREFPD